MDGRTAEWRTRRELLPPAKLIGVAVARRKIEEDHQVSERVTGLDGGQVTTWPRHDKEHREASTLRRRRHQYQARQARQRWHAHADELP